MIDTKQPNANRSIRHDVLVPHFAVTSYRDSDRHFVLEPPILSGSRPNCLGVILYSRGLATRLHELTATLFDFEETRMSDGTTYMMNGHICFPLSDCYRVTRASNEHASKLVGDDPHARLFDLAYKTMKG